MNFSLKLTNWYAKNKRSFPWRNTSNPYFIWLSEIILQQTRTEQGLPYYKKFCKEFPTITDLAQADETKILKLWQGLGYYSRARNLHFTAKHIVNDLNDTFPDNYNDLLKLKGVGDYTASAIASIAFNENCAVVDGNVYRVLSRYFSIKTPINSSAGIKEFKLLAQELLPAKKFGNHNQAIMDFGATICTPKKPKCKSCIFNDSCLALQKKTVDKLPIKTSKTKVRKRYFNYLVILTPQKETIIQQRTQKGIWQNLYEFPLIETDLEVDENYLQKTPLYKTFFSNKITAIYLYNTKTIIHKLSHQHIHTRFWIIDSPKLKNAIPYYSIKKYPVPTLINNFIVDFKI